MARKHVNLSELLITCILLINVTLDIAFTRNFTENLIKYTNNNDDT